MDLREGLYPKAPSDADSKWGAQQFADPDYVPIPLDSEGAATARLLAALEAGDDEATARSKALAGSDEAGTVKRIFNNVMDERAALLALNRTAKDYETKVAATAKLLDSAKWLAAVPKLESLEL